MNLNDFAQAFAQENRCMAGVCPATRLDEIQPILNDCFTPFVSRNIEKRINPETIQHGVKHIIVLGVGLPEPSDKKLDGISLNTAGHPDEPYGYLSTLGTRIDYHLVLKTLLQDLTAQLQVATPCRCKILVDSGTLNERALAVRAGLGFVGRSGMVISPVFGPYMYIGCLLTDAESEPYTTETAYGLSACPLDCRRCIDACPTKAITPEGKTINATACVSYLTQKELLTDWEQERISLQLYGCDQCRRVCPFASSMGMPPVDTCIPLSELVDISDDAFAKRFGSTAMHWRGASILRRNARIAAANFVRMTANELCDEIERSNRQV